MEALGIELAIYLFEGDCSSNGGSAAAAAAAAAPQVQRNAAAVRTAQLHSLLLSGFHVLHAANARHS